MVRPDLASSAQVEVRDPVGSLTIYGETPPKLAYGSDGTIYAAYLVTRAIPGHQWPVNTLRFASSTDHGVRWSGAATVQADTAYGGSTDDHALLVAPDGTLYLSWLAMTGDTSHTYAAHSQDQGKTWSVPVKVDSGPSCPCCRTALAVGPDGRLFAAWRKIYHPGSGQMRDIVVAFSSDRGATWSTPVRVHHDDWHVDYCPDAGPTIKVARDGVVHVAWWTGRPGGAGVRYTQSRDGGRSFTAPIPLGVAAASRAAHAQLALGPANQVVVAWDDGTRAIPPIVLRISSDGGRTFSAADTLTSPGESAGYPVVAIGRDSVYVAWQQRSERGVATDSLRHLHEIEALSQPKSQRPASEQWINPVGSWSVVLRAAAIRS
ncbi:MAG TPA: sialidase family protein [Gemmatimonadales bacterium]|nr:sialidase family protein [Gemmatimonadales bacterium]